MADRDDGQSISTNGSTSGGDGPTDVVLADDTQRIRQPAEPSGDIRAGEGEGAPASAGAALPPGDAPGAAPPHDDPPPGKRPRPTPRRIAIRRGVVLFLLLIAMLSSTAFFREGDGGAMHGVKSALTSISGRVQSITSAALRPVRDGWDWFSELRTARDDRIRLQKEVETLRAQQLGSRIDAQRLAQLEDLLKVRDATPADYLPVAANIIRRPLVDVAREARIDRGSANGVTVNSLVFISRGTDQGKDQGFFGILVGRVDHVDTHTADITFLTNPDTAVAARTLLGDTKLGLLKANALGDLILTGVPTSSAISVNDAVVTMGVGTDTLMSPYPAGLPIGYVSSYGGGGSGGSWTVQVTPYADPNDVSQVMILVPKTTLAKRRAGLQ